ncbi:MAG: ester cyclase, partial [Chloroflexota bacterium]|nr:ester cyclase [Chloroflexota bacterium]
LLRAAFPDLTVSIEEVLTDGDLVAVRYTRTGTHQGEYLGIPATGVAASWTGINVYRIECGRIAESWNETDNLELLRQLGAMPAGQSSTTAAAGTPPALGASPAAVSCPTTTEDENGAIARQWEEEVLGQGNLDLANDLLADDFAHDGAIGAEAASREERIQRVVDFRTAFPDLSVTVEEVLTEDDLVVVRYTNTATHQGEYAGIAPTGREVAWTGIIVFRIECGRIIETWSESDRLGLIQQLENSAEPAMPEATPAS